MQAEHQFPSDTEGILLSYEGKKLFFRCDVQDINERKPETAIDGEIEVIYKQLIILQTCLANFPGKNAITLEDNLIDRGDKKTSLLLMALLWCNGAEMARFKTDAIISSSFTISDTMTIPKSSLKAH